MEGRYVVEGEKLEAEEKGEKVTPYDEEGHKLPSY